MRPHRNERNVVAYHEAGHAVMCRLLRVRIETVDIGGDELYGGRILHGNPMVATSSASADSIRARLKIEKAIMLCLAGPLAQRKYDPHLTDYGGAVDLEVAMTLAANFFRSRKIAAAYINFATEWVWQKWNDPKIWSTVERLARALIERKRLSGRQVNAIIRGVS